MAQAGQQARMTSRQGTSRQRQLAWGRLRQYPAQQQLNATGECCTAGCETAHRHTASLMLHKLTRTPPTPPIPQGYTIPLDKRLAADGRGLQEVAINDQFAKFTEALYIAEQKARSAVEARAKMQRELLAREKERKERELRELALKARMDRLGGGGVAGVTGDPGHACPACAALPVHTRGWCVRCCQFCRWLPVRPASINPPVHFISCRQIAWTTAYPRLQLRRLRQAAAAAAPPKLPWMCRRTRMTAAAGGTVRAVRAARSGGAAGGRSVSGSLARSVRSGGSARRFGRSDAGGGGALWAAALAKGLEGAALACLQLCCRALYCCCCCCCCFPLRNSKLPLKPLKDASPMLTPRWQGAGAGAAAGGARGARLQEEQDHARPRPRHLRKDCAGHGQGGPHRLGSPADQAAQWQADCGA